jgi:hypothetical protein
MTKLALSIAIVAATATSALADPPDLPRAPAKLAQMTRQSGGAWKCSGSAAVDGKQTALKAKMSVKLDTSLDRWWIQGTFAETRKGGIKYTSYTTLDEKTGRWHRVLVDNAGGYETVESAGGTTGKVDWEGVSRGPRGTAKTKHHEEMVSAKEVKMWGELTTDDGASWQKSYDVTCKQ